CGGGADSGGQPWGRRKAASASVDCPASRSRPASVCLQSNAVSAPTRSTQRDYGQTKMSSNLPPRPPTRWRRSGQHRGFPLAAGFLHSSGARHGCVLDCNDLCPDTPILASKHVEAQPRGRRNAIIVLVSDDLEQLGRAIAALGGDNAKLGHVPTDGIRQHRSLTNQKLP